MYLSKINLLRLPRRWDQMRLTPNRIQIHNRRIPRPAHNLLCLLHIPLQQLRRQMRYIIHPTPMLCQSQIILWQTLNNEE